MVLDHIGVVVRSIDEGIRNWASTFGYAQMTSPVHNSRQNVRVVFLEKEGSTLVKLIEPASPSSPISALSSKGGGLHHLCFRVPDIQRAVRDLKAAGGVVLVPPEPGEAFENEPISFVYIHGLPTEVISTEKKAGLLKGRR